MADSREIAALGTRIRHLEERVDQLERLNAEEPNTSIEESLEDSRNSVFLMLLLELHRVVPGFSASEFRRKVVAMQDESCAAMPRRTDVERMLADFITRRTKELMDKLLPSLDDEPL